MKTQCDTKWILKYYVGQLQASRAKLLQLLRFLLSRFCNSVAAAANGMKGSEDYKLIQQQQF
jgi:hypothetical protein